MMTKALTVDVRSAAAAAVDAAGITRQAAHERWGRRVTQVLDRYRTGEPGGPVADDETDLG
jgi:hypothetical protein